VRSRLALGAFGTVVSAYGAFLLLSRQQLEDAVEVAIWFAVGVVLHDFVLAPLMLVVGVVMMRMLPAAARAPAVVGLVVLGSITLLAVPVLGGFGVQADNPTLFDRPYLAGWAVLAGLVLAGVLAASLARRSPGSHRDEEPDGARPGR